MKQNAVARTAFIAVFDFKSPVADWPTRAARSRDFFSRENALISDRRYTNTVAILAQGTHQA